MYLNGEQQHTVFVAKIADKRAQIRHSLALRPKQLFNFSGSETTGANFVFANTKICTQSRQLVSLALAFAA